MKIYSNDSFQEICVLPQGGGGGAGKNIKSAISYMLLNNNGLYPVSLHLLLFSIMLIVLVSFRMYCRNCSIV